MSIRDIWQALDDKLQEEFHGHWGEAAFRESFTVVGMIYAHKYIKLSLHPSSHDALDRAWYGSLAPNHPLHVLRTSTQDAIGDVAQHVDDYFGSPIQKKFAAFDSFIVPKIERYVDDYIARHFD